jgi:hypothetical protein
MRYRSALRLYALLVGALVFAVAPVHAQFVPRPLGETVTGESYHIEAALGLWNPSADMAIASESLGIIGTRIDFRNDLGLTDQRFREFHLTLRPARKHKFRFQHIPISYTQDAIANREIVFNGQRYRVGVPVTSTLDWSAYRFGYEYDFLARDRWYAGFVLEAKYTDVNASLATPISREFAHARAPIPAIGGTFRVYPARNVSVTGEVTTFRLPESLIEDASAHYVDVDFYGTYNINNYVGAQMGYRSFDLGYVIDDDFGDFRLRGFYFGVVARY